MVITSTLSARIWLQKEKKKKNNEPSVDPRGKRRRESIERMLEINESEMDRN